MYIWAMSMDGKYRAGVTISKKTSIEELRSMVSEIFVASVDRLRLFFRGKQLENKYKLIDYNINLNDVVQVMVKEENQTLKTDASAPNPKDSDHRPMESDGRSVGNRFSENEYHYKVGDIVEYVDAETGSWCESCICEIILPSNKTSVEDEDRNIDPKYINLKLKCLRTGRFITVDSTKVAPHSKVKVPFQSLKVGGTVLINYNIEVPDELGYWYAAVIEYISTNPKPFLKASLEMFVDNKIEILRNCEIRNIDNIFLFKKLNMLPQKNSVLKDSTTESTDKPEVCAHCNDDPSKKCCYCNCSVCGGKDQPEKQILCDECDKSFHLWCLSPPLHEIPQSDDWYCPDCKNDENEIVKAGEGLKFSKKRLNMKSASDENTRDWGKGMACAGRTKVCTLVPPNHFGPIPGIEVGTCWKFRLQVSEAGVHRPHVAGIHGRSDEGAYSIVLSGGYEDDIDSGEYFIYTGSGGRDLSGNKRTAEQSCDQTLTRYNLALALNCNARLDKKKGATAEDWKKGKPVRVVRNYKLKKHSEFAPTDGNRYDGVYKVVKYYPVKGKSGFIIWRYELHRDDPTPAPWTNEGKRWIESHGLEAIRYPDGFLEIDKSNQENKRKRILTDSGNDANHTNKKAKVSYDIDDKLRKYINNDTCNGKLWNVVLLKLENGKQDFLSEVENSFTCICCQDVVNSPVSTPCLHNICRECLARSFKADVYSCPYCRYDLGVDFKFIINENLQKILLQLFPGYNVGRL